MGERVSRETVGDELTQNEQDAATALVLAALGRGVTEIVPDSPIILELAEEARTQLDITAFQDREDYGEDGAQYKLRWLTVAEALNEDDEGRLNPGVVGFAAELLNETVALERQNTTEGLYIGIEPGQQQ